MTTDTVVAEEVTFPADGRTIPGTLTRPASSTGPHPAVLLLAGSGPTDRDWNSPLLPGKNGSAKQLAEALSAAGLVVLRFDKAFSGRNSGPALPQLTLDTYLAEARAALALLAARPEVDRTRLFVAGSSEGAIHATRLAQTSPPGLRGVIFLAGPGRSLRVVLATQLENNFRNAPDVPPEEVDARMKPIREGLADFAAGKDVDPKSLSPLPQLQAIFGNLMAPPVAAIGRALLAFEPTVEATRIAVPVLVLQGGKDIQVDPVLDAEPLAEALKAAGRAVTFHVSPDANHVFKHEPLSVPELRANLVAVQTGYVAPGRHLDPDAVTTLLAWIRARSS